MEDRTEDQMVEAIDWHAEQAIDRPYPVTEAEWLGETRQERFDRIGLPRMLAPLK